MAVTISFATCNDSLDPVGGYGNSWHQLLSYRATVADPATSAVVNVTATLQIESEPGYDYVHLSSRLSGNIAYTDFQSWDGRATVAVNHGFTFAPAELIEGTDVLVLFRKKLPRKVIRSSRKGRLSWKPLSRLIM